LSKKTNKYKQFQEKFRRLLKGAADELGIDPSEVSKAQFSRYAEDQIKEWDMRIHGGFNSLKDLYFPVPVEAASKHGVQLLRKHKNKLEKEYGTRDFIQTEIVNNIKELLEKNPIRMHKPLKKVNNKKKKKKIDRTIIAHLSDTHYGANIDEKEMSGVNKFDWTIASRRTALFFEQVCKYKPQYRENTDLVLVINGDLIAGLIHNTDHFVDVWSLQFLGAVDILVQGISYLANNFSKVRVECTTGNHGRIPFPDSGRATTTKWNSFESTIYHTVRYALESKHKNVSFHIPASPFNIIDVQGHKFFATHSDTVFSTGNVGSSMNMKSLNTQIAKLNASQLGGTGTKFAGVLCGHVHVPTIQLTESGCMLIVNGTLSGTDPFAQSIGIFENHPTQQLIEVTSKFAVGDIRFIQLQEADNDSKYDEIIKPFRGTFE
jgi:predicted phosphodiesterase